MYIIPTSHGFHPSPGMVGQALSTLEKIMYQVDLEVQISIAKDFINGEKILGIYNNGAQ